MIKFFTLAMLLSLSSFILAQEKSGSVVAQEKSGDIIVREKSGSVVAQEKSGGIITIEGEERVEPVIKIFPVPVLNSRFTITSDMPFTSVRMTNIIGQEILRERFGYPRVRSEFNFSPTEKGIYLITIEMENKTRVVRKILIGTGY